MKNYETYKGAVDAVAAFMLKPYWKQHKWVIRDSTDGSLSHFGATDREVRKLFAIERINCQPFI